MALAPLKPINAALEAQKKANATKAFDAALKKSPAQNQPQAVQPKVVQPLTQQGPVAPANGGAAQLDKLSSFAASFPQRPPSIMPADTPTPASPGPVPTAPAKGSDPKLEGVLDKMAKGKSLDAASKESGYKNGDEGYKAFSDNKAYKTEQSNPSGDARVTKITAPDGRLVVENYDYQHGQYYTQVGQGDKVTKSNPVRDEAGWKVTSDVDKKTGLVTTKRENDLGAGEKEESTRLKNGVTVDVATDAKGAERTEVTSPNGTKTSIDGRFDPTKGDPKAILKGVHSTKTSLTDEDVATFQAHGYDVKQSGGNGDSGDVTTTTVIDPKSGQPVVTATEEDRGLNGTSVAYADDKGGKVTRSTDDSGKVAETTTNKHGVVYERTTPAGGGEAKVTVNGREVAPGNLLDNGTAKVTLANGKKGAILPTGQTVELNDLQSGKGGYGGFIEKGLAEGKSLDVLAKHLGWSRDQVSAELYLNGADDVQIREGTAAKLGLDPKSLGVSDAAKVTLSSVTRDGVTLNSVTTPANDGKPFNYEVKPNDNLWDIAEKHGLTVDELLKNPDNAKLVDGKPDEIDVGNKIVIENGTLTHVGYSFEKDDLAVSGPTKEPVADGGLLTLDAKEGDTTKSLSEKYPWLKPADIVAANPQLAGGKIKPGDKVAIPDSARLAAMQSQAKARGELSPADLAALKDGGKTFDAVDDKGDPKAPGAVALVDGLATEIDYATRRGATPVDALPELTKELKARRPGDTAWASAVDLAAKQSTANWAAQGRSPAVMNPLYEMANPQGADQVKKFKDHTKDVFKAAAVADATPASIERARDNLLAFGPQDPASQQAIKDAAQDFLVNDPKAKAADIKKAYDEGGETPLSKTAAGARKLAELTDPKTVDPLTAALVLKNAQPTVDKIASDLAPYDNEKIWSLYASDVSFVKQEGADASQAYADLSSASEGASRSPEGRAAVSRLAGQLKDRDLYSDQGTSPLNSGGVSLSLEIAAQKRKAGDADGASKVEGSVLKAVDAAEKGLVEDGKELGNLAAPLVLPESEWGPLLGDRKAPPDWFKDKGTLDKIEAKNGEIDKGSQWLELAYQGIERHRTDLAGSPHEKALGEKGDPAKMSPELKMLFETSPSAGVERVRAMAEAGQTSGGLEKPTIIPEWSWPARLVRNSGQNGYAYFKETAKPTNLGLSLFGLGTYVLGTDHKLQEGGKGVVTAGLYIAGGVTEAYAAVGQISQHFRWAQGDARWQKVLTAGAGNSPAVKLFSNAPLRALGWWNAYNSVASLSEGELWPAFLHGAAAGGIYLSTTGFAGGVPGWLTKLGVGARFTGNLITLAASTGLAVYDMYKTREPIENLAESHKNYLVAAGIDPDMADALGILPGKEGISAAPRLQALAEYRGTTPEAMLDYLLKQKPRDVFELVYAADYVKPGDDGKMPVGEPSPAWESKPPIKADFRPKTTAELNQFLDHYFSGAPGKTP